MDAGDTPKVTDTCSPQYNLHSPPVTYDLSDTENDLEGPTDRAQLPSPVSHYTFQNPRYFFPVPFENLRRHHPQTSMFDAQTEILDSTISEIDADFQRFGATSPLQEPCLAPPRRVSSPAVGNFASTPDSPAPCTSISMLIHSSMENQALTPQKASRLRTRFTATATQRLQEELYEAVGEKPSNAIEENQLLYQTLDCWRKRLILCKAISSLLGGALARQREKLEFAESRNKIKSEEGAARLIFHSLLLQAYRHVKNQLSQLITENVQLQKSVENLCLQLRVVRHLQSAEKERVVEKIHEIGNLKTELTYVKKTLGKTKSELEKAEQECEALEKGNAGLAEEKYKTQREQRLIEEKKEMLQASLEMEKKRTDKHAANAKDLKRQVVDLRGQISELMKQCDDFNERARAFEARNWELQMLLESRGKEVIELGQARDKLQNEGTALEQLIMKIHTKNEEMTLEIKAQEKAAVNLKKCLDGAETHVRQQSSRIGYLEDEVGRMTRANMYLRNELSTYQLINIRRRRNWVNFAMGFCDPLGAIVSYVIGRPNEFIIWN